MFFSPHAKGRIDALLRRPCKCSSGACYKQLHKPDVVHFLQTFQKLGKREQDAVLFLACGTDTFGGSGPTKRREYYVLGNHMKRSCMEHLLGISSHRTDRIGTLDLRYGGCLARPTELTASIVSFCCIVYNSIAEPLPDRFQQLNIKTFFIPTWGVVSLDYTCLFFSCLSLICFLIALQ